jgi:dTDP-4-amino-4,6-dideoxygalactose transaminase
MSSTSISFKIPFNKPGLAGKEMDYVLDAIRRGHISGDGVYTKQCSALLEKALEWDGQRPKVLLTTSCTHALEMAALLLDLQPGDEVILPSFTFVSTVNAFVLRGIRPIFADIRRDTLNIDESILESFIGPRTRAIVVVHYAGVACEMEHILELAGRYGLQVVEDNAHGLFGKYHGKPLGTFGSLATLSFHETKNITCGEGGAILINRPDLFERAEILREKGTNRSRFFRGQVDKYTWVDVGSSYLPSDILAAYLQAQLEHGAEIQNRRQEIWDTYFDGLHDWADHNGVALPFIPGHCEQAYHMFYLLLPDLERRQAFIAYMKERGILCVFHYLPLHLSDMGRKYGGKPGDCPVTEDISDRLVRLPFYNLMTPGEQAQVIEAIQEFG